MDLDEIHSIQLDREMPFNQKIKLFDKDGNMIDQIPVNAERAWDIFTEIFEAWERHKREKR